jgi:hypothetical protein
LIISLAVGSRRSAVASEVFITIVIIVITIFLDLIRVIIPVQ